MDESAEEGRNRSLLASLAFSTRRLSEEARGVLPYLAWFEGGVLENHLRNFTRIDTGVWERIRVELVATALIRLEEVGFNTPFLRFHPTLPFAARPFREPANEVGDLEAVETRFIDVYVSVGQEVDRSLFGSQPAFGMAVLAIEEPNFRSALQRAFRRGALQVGAGLSLLLTEYLQMTGRVRERDDFVAWVRLQLPVDAGLDEATCEVIQRYSLSLLSQGRPDEAIATVQELIARLEAEGFFSGEDPTLQTAKSYRELGALYVQTRRLDHAVEASKRAIGLLEGLHDDVANKVLHAILNDLANSYLLLGRVDQALAAADRALKIDRELSWSRASAVSLGTIARFLGSAN